METFHDEYHALFTENELTACIAFLGKIIYENIFSCAQRMRKKPNTAVLRRACGIFRAKRENIFIK